MEEAGVWAFDRTRHLQGDWGLLADVLAGSAAEWLPEPLTMVGVHEFSGVVEVLGMQVRVDYVAPGAWRHGQRLSRRVTVAPKDKVFAGVDGRLSLRAEGEALAQLRFVGTRLPPRSMLARPFGHLTSSSLVTRLMDSAWSRLDEARLEARLADGVEHPSGRS